MMATTHSQTRSTCQAGGSIQPPSSVYANWTQRAGKKTFKNPQVTGSCLFSLLQPWLGEAYPLPPEHVMFYKLAQPQDSAPNLWASHCRLGHLALGACRWTLTDNRLRGSHWTEDLAWSILNTEKEKRLLLQVHNGELEKQRTSCVHSTTPAKQFSLCLLLAVVRYCLPSPDMGVGWCPQSQQVQTGAQSRSPRVCSLSSSSFMFTLPNTLSL